MTSAQGRFQVGLYTYVERKVWTALENSLTSMTSRSLNVKGRPFDLILNREGFEPDPQEQRFKFIACLICQKKRSENGLTIKCGVYIWLLKCHEQTRVKYAAKAVEQIFPQS